jgi:hypothetical protein
MALELIWLPSIAIRPSIRTAVQAARTEKKP